MIVDPMPPAWRWRSVPGEAHDAWLGQCSRTSSAGARPEIDFVNGYVVNFGRRLGVRTPDNAAVVEPVYGITRRQTSPDPALLGRILQPSR